MDEGSDTVEAVSTDEGSNAVEVNDRLNGNCCNGGLQFKMKAHKQS